MPGFDLIFYPVTPDRWPDLERLFGPRGRQFRLLVHVVATSARSNSAGRPPQSIGRD